MKVSKLACCFGLLFVASTTFAQMYTAIDLGTLGGVGSSASGINDLGQVIGWADTTVHHDIRAFRTSANAPINTATDDLGSLGSYHTDPAAINASGQVVGMSFLDTGGVDAFRTAPNSPINPATDDLGPLNGGSYAKDINASGQVVGAFYNTADLPPGKTRAFRIPANRIINPATDDLGTLGGGFAVATSINDSGVVVGFSSISNDSEWHAFRTAANSPIDPATDDLGTLGGTLSSASSLNASGQVVGNSTTIPGDVPYVPAHAFRTAANSRINPLTDDLGTLGGTWSDALDIDDYGQVLGTSAIPGDVSQHPFLFSNGVMHDLSNLITGCELMSVVGLNNAGQIAGYGLCNGAGRAIRLDPIFKAFVQQPINRDGSSVFNARRGVVPVKFTLTEFGAPTCALLPATIALTRTAGGTVGSIDESTYVANADSGPDFRISSCQYIYNLPASSLGVGTYRVDISINGIMVGHAVFALK